MKISASAASSFKRAKPAPASRAAALRSNPQSAAIAAPWMAGGPSVANRDNVVRLASPPKAARASTAARRVISLALPSSAAVSATDRKASSRQSPASLIASAREASSGLSISGRSAATRSPAGRTLRTRVAVAITGSSRAGSGASVSLSMAARSLGSPTSASRLRKFTRDGASLRSIHQFAQGVERVRRAIGAHEQPETGQVCSPDSVCPP